ncbi:transposase family protein [Actinophytocola algeriensis]|uniref:transposase family protein n=1 Tax=Actinophytocola algeriensis TaxID=1768010 RepID=UPI001607AC5A
MDATEIRVRDSVRKREGRKRFISGKSRQHAVEALIISDARGRVLFGGASCPGSTADITQARQAGIVDWLNHTTGVEIFTNAGYQGLGRHTFGQVVTPTPKHHKNASRTCPASPNSATRNAKPTHTDEPGSSTPSPPRELAHPHPPPRPPPDSRRHHPRHRRATLQPGYGHDGGAVAASVLWTPILELVTASPAAVNPPIVSSATCRA